MRRALVALSTLVMIGLGLSGCGLFRWEQREPWRTEAEEACLSQRLVQPNDYMSRASRIDGPGSCGMDYPFKVSAFAGGSIALRKQATLACPIIPRVDAWLDEVVKPAALLYFGQRVIDLKAGSYSCRSRNNQGGAKLSEHSFGNAVDVMGFVLSDGREVSVLRGWRGDPAEQEFLREVFVGACRHFTTVLGPGADRFHSDHLHIDLARHDPVGQRQICKPVLKFAPRIEPAIGRPVATSRNWTRFSPELPQREADLPPLDFEEEPALDGEPASRAPGRPPTSMSRSGPGVSDPLPRPIREPAGLPLYNRPPAAPAISNGHGLY